MKSLQEKKSTRIIARFVRALMDSLFPQSTFADMLLFIWVFLIAAVVHHQRLLSYVQRAVSLAWENITRDFDASQGFLEIIAALAHGLWTAATYAWLVLIVVVAIAIPLSTIISEALRPRELTFYEKKELSYAVRFFYAGLALAGIFMATCELYNLLQEPQAGWLAPFNIGLVGIVCLQRALVFALAVCSDDGKEDSWARDFFAAMLSSTPVKLPAVLLSLAAAPGVFYLVCRQECGVLWAIFLTYVYTSIAMQALSTLLGKIKMPHGAAK